jgi:hypothetical protein
MEPVYQKTTLSPSEWIERPIFQSPFAKAPNGAGATIPHIPYPKRRQPQTRSRLHRHPLSPTEPPHHLHLRQGLTKADLNAHDRNPIQRPGIIPTTPRIWTSNSTMPIPDPSIASAPFISGAGISAWTVSIRDLSRAQSGIMHHLVSRRQRRSSGAGGPTGALRRFMCTGRKRSGVLLRGDWDYMFLRMKVYVDL